MDIHRLSSTFKERVAAELRSAKDPSKREEILIEALYDLSRTILPPLGYPKKNDEYHGRQAAVLDLITFLAIDLIRCATARRGVTVLSEVGEGCHDPLLKKKLSVYAQQLLDKLDRETGRSSFHIGRCLAWVAGSLGAAGLAFYVATNIGGFAVQSERHAAAPPEVVTEPSAAYHASSPAASPAAVATTARDRSEERLRTADQPATELKGAAPQGEQITRIRVVHNQLLVPVTLVNNGESVKVELVLDTGATRTAIHESLARRLNIDLRTAKPSQAEVADGRVITSRKVMIEAVIVGPHSMGAADVELIPYRGADGLHDGLLGMDFLGKRRYQVDMDREVIRWFP